MRDLITHLHTSKNDSYSKINVHQNYHNEAHLASSCEKFCLRTLFIFKNKCSRQYVLTKSLS